MKKLIALVLTFAMILSLASSAVADLYPATFLIVEINREADIVYAIDFSGNEWIFDDPEDLEVGDLISVIMNDMTTPSIYDDEIVMFNYAGRADMAWPYEQ